MKPRGLIAQIAFQSMNVPQQIARADEYVPKNLLDLSEYHCRASAFTLRLNPADVETMWQDW
jgi:hypothetical protein